MTVNGEPICLNEYVSVILGSTSTHAIHLEDEELNLFEGLENLEFQEMNLENRPGRNNFVYAR